MALPNYTTQWKTGGQQQRPQTTQANSYAPRQQQQSQSVYSPQTTAPFPTVMPDPKGTAPRNTNPVVQPSRPGGGTMAPFPTVYPDPPRNTNPVQPPPTTQPPTTTQPPLTQDPGYQGPWNPPANNADHPFFDPGSNYGQPGRQWGQLPGAGQPGNNPWNNYGTDNPEGYYYAFLNERGLGGFDARSQVAQGMFRDVARGYEAAKMRNMELWFPEYLEQWDPNDVLDLLSEEQLGIDRSRFGGRDRWGMRGGQ
jgi:hypothetical protein